MCAIKREPLTRLNGSLCVSNPYSNVDMNDLSRRRFVLGTGAVAATGALAGCGGNGNGNGNGDDGNGNGEPASPEDRAVDFLNENDARGFDGDITDEHGQDEVVVDVGAGDNGFAFAPAAIAVDAGTTVLWRWTGEGGQHNVVSEPDSDFEVESERVADEGHEFTQTFDEEGVLLYVCTPHRAQGKFGAVIVE